MALLVKNQLCRSCSGALATLMPQVMGIGYDTVNSALLGEIGYSVLALLLLFKMLATTASVGMGIPGGMIGPALFMGSILGSLFAQIANIYCPTPASMWDSTRC